MNKFQAEVRNWMHECFGAWRSTDKMERNYRFIEEALELIQACGATKEGAHALVEYVFNRPIGSPPQEVGGVMVTLAGVCNANNLDMEACGTVELFRVWGLIPQIRAKQAPKPGNAQA